MQSETIEIRDLTADLLPDFLGFFEGAASCAGLKARGLRVAEAMPKPEVAGDAENHYGPLSLFTGAGFAFHRQGEHGSVYVRKELR